MGRSDSSRAVRPSDWMPSSFESRMTMRCIVAKKRVPHKREKNRPQSPFFKGEVTKIGKRNFHKRHSKGLRFCVPLFKKACPEPDRREGPGKIFGRELYSEPTTPRHLSGPCLQRWATI